MRIYLSKIELQSKIFEFNIQYSIMVKTDKLRYLTYYQSRLQQYKRNHIIKQYYNNHMCSKNIHLLVLVLLVLLLGAKSQSNCAHTPQIQDLQAGFATLNLQQANTNLPRTEYNKIKSQKIDYPLQTAMSKKPAVAIGIEDININSIFLQEFHLEVFSSNTTTVVFQFSYKPSAWKIIKFNFWISSRSDIILGTYVQDLGSVFNQTKNVIIKFSTPVKNFQKMITRALLNGFSVNEPRTKSVNLALKANQCEEYQQVFQVYTGQSFDLKTIWMSLFIFSPSDVPFASYGGGYQRQNWQGYSVESIHRFIPGLKYPIFGFIQLQLRTEGPLQLNLSIDPDLVFENQASRNVQKYAAHYILAGQTASSSCNKCNLLNYRNSCVDKCPQTSYIFEYSNGGKACLECSAKLNLRLNSQKSGCICVAGFVQNSEGKCIKQQNSENSGNSGNNQSSPSNNNNNPNQGSSNTSNNQGTSNNINSCSSPNTYWTGYKCICKPGFYLEQGKCIKYEITSSSKIFNVPSIFYKKMQQQIYDNHKKTQELQTVIYQPSNQFINPIANQIVNPIVSPIVNPIINPIVSPIANQIFPNNKEQYYQQPQQPLIGVPSHKNYYQASCGVCHNAPLAPVQNPCYANQYFNGKRCQCIDGFIRVNQVCEQKTEPPTKCLPNSYIDSNGYCQCLNEFQYDKNLNQCVKKCPINSHPSDSNDKCQCNIGFVFNGLTQDCQQIYCPPYSSFSQQEYKCICDDGRIQVGDSCLRCPPDLVWSQTFKRCAKGCVGNQFFDPNQQKCVCQSGFALYQDQCQRCPQNHIIVNGYCERCPTNTFFNNNTYKCECLQGYSRNGVGSCSKICNDTFWFNSKNGACECPQYTYLIAGKCSNCPQGTQYNSQKKTCQVNNRCPAGQSQVKGQCICNDGKGFILKNETYVCVDCYQLEGGYLKDGHCFKCPGQTIFINGGCNCPNGLVKDSNNKCNPKQPECGSNQFFNLQTYKCECINGFFWISGQCSTCPSGRFYNSVTKTCDLIPPKCPNNLVENNGECICPPNLGFFTNSNGIKQCINCFSITGGYLENGICRKCPGQTVFTNGGCNCPNGLIKDSNNNCNPKQPECGAYQFFNQQTYKCECVDGYFWISGQCSKCPSGRVYNPSTKNCDLIPPKCPNNLIEKNGDCICPSNLGFFTNNNGVRECINCSSLTGGYLQNGICRKCPGQTVFTNGGCNCPNGLIKDSNNNCNPKQPECGAYQFFNQQTYKCECVDGYFWISGQCSKCPSGKVYNPITKTCELIPPVCPNNQVYLNGKCICRSGTGFNNQGNCIDCTTLRGGYLQNGFCKQCQGQTIRISNSCQCPNGTVIDQFKNCNKKIVCPHPQVYNQNKQLCECPSNLVRIGGICSTCPFGTQYIISSQTCRLICTKNQIRDSYGNCKDCGHYEAPVNNVCQCVEGYKRNISTGVCEIVINKNCQPGWYWIDGKCQTCKPNSHYDVSLWKCVCSPGFIEDSNKNCKQRPQTLICPTGQHFFNGNCVLCPRFSYYDPIQKSCTCIFGFSMDQHGYCVAAYGGSSSVSTATSGSSSSSSGASTGSSSQTNSGSGLSAGSSSSAQTSNTGSTTSASAGSSASGSSSGSSSSASGSSSGSSSSASGSFTGSSSSIGTSSSAGSSTNGFSQSSTGTSSSSSTATGTTAQSGSITNTQTSSGFQSNINGSSGSITQTRNGNVITTVITSPNGATITQYTTVNDGDYNGASQNGYSNEQTNYGATNIYSNVNSGYGSSIETNQQTYGSNANINTANQGSHLNNQYTTSTQTSVQSANGQFVNQFQNTQGVNILNINNNGKVDQNSSGSIDINQQYVNINGKENNQNIGQVSGFGFQNNYGSNGSTQNNYGSNGSSQNNQNSYNQNSNQNSYQNWNQNNSYSTPQTPICGVKTYLNTWNNKCQACPEGCVYCSSLTSCSLCDIGFMLLDSKCVPRCGDGITKHPQQCDDGNFLNGDGCSKQCNIQYGFACSGTPSFCKSIFGNLNQGSSSSSGSAASSASGSSSSSAASTASSASGSSGRSSTSSSAAAAASAGSAAGSSSSSAAAAAAAAAAGSSGSASSSSSAASSASSGSSSGSSSSSSAASSSSSSSQQSSSSSSSASSASSSTVIAPTSHLQSNGPSLTLFKQPSSNTANVFIQLKTNPTFNFKSDIQMKKFIQYEFLDASTIPQGGVYCTQLKQDASVFRCLLNYNSGVPTKIYSVKFFYDYNGYQASTRVQIDTLKTMFSLRSLN